MIQQPCCPLPAASNSDGRGGSCNKPDFGAHGAAGEFPVRVYNGSEGRKANRQAPQTDVDYYPYLIRRYTNMSVTDVQLNNGLRFGVGRGRRIPYAGSGYLNVVQPIIPGQTRDNVAGWHRKGPSPYRVADVYANGPGAQPAHPGGPGKIAAPTFYNPMTG